MIADLNCGGKVRCHIPVVEKSEPWHEVRGWSATLHLAEHHGLSVYDAAYLEIASRRKIPLATLDPQLRAAATSEGVELLG
jgi:predicted nucleic acid-binding protein